jgi:hypothetical protein
MTLYYFCGFLPLKKAWYFILKLYVPSANNFLSVLKKRLDYDTGIFVELWNVKNVSAVLSTIIEL